VEYFRKDGREVPDTLAVTLDFPNEVVVSWRSTFSNLYPEHVNRPNGATLTGESPTPSHMANWIECIRSRSTPNASVKLGYRSTVACHMGNLSYRQKRKITWQEAKAFSSNFDGGQPTARGAKAGEVSTTQSRHEFVS
jgi:hypothetical protein